MPVNQSMTDINKSINHMLLHSSYQQRQKKEREKIVNVT